MRTALIASLALFLTALQAAAACTYKGQTYAEGKRTEAYSAENLCLPAGSCPSATVVLPAYRCTNGKWKCVQYCGQAAGGNAERLGEGRQDAAPQALPKAQQTPKLFRRAAPEAVEAEPGANPPQNPVVKKGRRIQEVVQEKKGGNTQQGNVGADPEPGGQERQGDAQGGGAAVNDRGDVYAPGKTGANNAAGRAAQGNLKGGDAYGGGQAHREGNAAIPKIGAPDIDGAGPAGHAQGGANQKQAPGRAGGGQPDAQGEKGGFNNLREHQGAADAAGTVYRKKQ